MEAKILYVQFWKKMKRGQLPSLESFLPKVPKEKSSREEFSEKHEETRNRANFEKGNVIWKFGEDCGAVWGEKLGKKNAREDKMSTNEML